MPETEKPRRLQCRHIFNNGHRCGAVCLRNEDFCYYHHSTRGRASRVRDQSNDQSTFELPLPEDRSAIQTSIGLVLQRIASGELDPRRAGLLLYGLQIASLNLPKEHHDPDRITPPPVDEVILHPELGPLAPESELPPPYRTSREQLIDWQTRDLTRRETELYRREQQLNEREAKIRAAERSQPAIVPQINAMIEIFEDRHFGGSTGLQPCEKSAPVQGASAPEVEPEEPSHFANATTKIGCAILRARTWREGWETTSPHTSFRSKRRAR